MKSDKLGTSMKRQVRESVSLNMMLFRSGLCEHSCCTESGWYSAQEEQHLCQRLWLPDIMTDNNDNWEDKQDRYVKTKQGQELTWRKKAIST